MSDEPAAQVIVVAPVAARIVRNGPKVKCPACGGYLSEVVAGYPLDESYRRRRRCLDCRATFRTDERATP
jgi:transposase-like protein